MNSMTQLFQRYATLKFRTKNQNIPNNRQTQNLNEKQREPLPGQQNQLDYDNPLTYFDDLITGLFTSIRNEDIDEKIEHYAYLAMNDLHENLTTEEFNDKYLSIIKDLQQYDGHDISLEVKNITNQETNENEVLVYVNISKIDKNENGTNNFTLIRTIALNDLEHNNFNPDLSYMLYHIITGTGYDILSDLSKQLTTTDVVTTNLFDNISRNMKYNPYYKITNWMIIFASSNDFNVAISPLGSYLLTDNTISLMTLYTLLYQVKLPERLTNLYSMKDSTERISDTDDLTSFITKVEARDNRPIIDVNFIAPTGLELRRQIKLKHRLRNRRVRTVITKRMDMFNMVRDFYGSE